MNHASRVSKVIPRRNGNHNSPIRYFFNVSNTDGNTCGFTANRIVLYSFTLGKCSKTHYTSSSKSLTLFFTTHENVCITSVFTPCCNARNRRHPLSQRLYIGFYLTSLSPIYREIIYCPKRIRFVSFLLCHYQNNQWKYLQVHT